MFNKEFANNVAQEFVRNNSQGGYLEKYCKKKVRPLKYDY
jgi:hypothetical protein